MVEAPNRRAFLFGAAGAGLVAGPAVHIASVRGVLSFDLGTGDPLRTVELERVRVLAAGSGALYARTDHHVVAFAL